MLDLDNRSRWAAGVYPGWSRQGKRQLVVVVKAGFAFDLEGKVKPLEAPEEIEPVDRYRGEAGLSSLAAAAEAVPFKAGGELLLSGIAHPPPGERTVMEVEVGVDRQGGEPWRKVLRVFGPRRWERGLLGSAPGKAGPLAPVPLIYENAFGGSDGGDPDKPFGPNPVGQGYSARGWRLGEAGVPQIEIGPRFLCAPGQKVPPAGFGPLAPLWEPRLANFSALDEEAVTWGGAPFGDKAPEDLYNAAPPDQRFPEPFRGGETLRLKGFFPDHHEPVAILLPKSRPQVLVLEGSQKASLGTVCDTLCVDTDRRQLHLLWRGAVDWNLRENRRGWVVVRDMADIGNAADGREGA